MPTERQLQQNIEVRINLTSLFYATVIDVNLIPFKDKKTGEFKMIRNQATPGAADINVQGPERKSFWIEVKLPGRQLTATQILWAQRLQAKGGKIYLAHSVDDALNACAEECRIHGWKDERLEAMLK